jgi:isochorismate synthase EntC
VRALNIAITKQIVKKFTKVILYKKGMMHQGKYRQIALKKTLLGLEVADGLCYDFSVGLTGQSIFFGSIC